MRGSNSRLYVTTVALDSGPLLFVLQEVVPGIHGCSLDWTVFNSYAVAMIYKVREQPLCFVSEHA